MAAIRDAQGNLINIDPGFLKTALDYQAAPLLSADALRSVAETGQVPDENPDQRFKNLPATPSEQKLGEAQQYATENIGSSARAVQEMDRWTTQNIPGAAPSTLAQPPQRAESVDSSGKIVVRAQPATDLGVVRTRFAQELANNPDLSRKLMASTVAEVGDQGEAAKTAYLESVMNRAAARGKSLDETISDPSYYPKVTIARLGRPISASDQDYLSSLVGRVLGGSNIANYATGNESGNEHSGGAQVTFNPKTGERFVVENPDVAWSRSAPPPSGGQTVAAGDTVGPATPVYIQPVDRSTIKTPTGRNDLSAEDVSNYARVQADDYATTLAKAGTPLTVGEYKQQLSNFYLAAQKQNLGIQPERLPADQGDALASLHQGIDLIDQITEKQKILTDKYGTLYGTTISQPLIQTDEYKDFDAARQLAISTLARGVGGQKGQLSDSDVKIMKDALPNEHDTPAQAASKAAILKQMSLTMMQDKINYLGNNHYDVSGVNQLFLDAQAKFQATRHDKSLDPAQNANLRQSYLDKAAAKVKPVPIQQSPQPMTGAPPLTQQPPMQPITAESLVGSD